MFISSGFSNYWTSSYSPIPQLVHSSLTFILFQNKHLLLFYLNLIIAVKSVQNIQLSPILNYFTLFHQSSSLSFVCCSGLCYTRAAGSDSEGSPCSACWRGHEVVSPSEHKDYELAPSCSVSAVWWGGASPGLYQHSLIQGILGVVALLLWLTSSMEFLLWEAELCAKRYGSLLLPYISCFVTNSFFSSWRAVTLDSFCNFPVLPRVHHLATNLANRSGLLWEFWLWNCLFILEGSSEKFLNTS